jgi:hypothetical protein
MTICTTWREGRRPSRLGGIWRPGFPEAAVIGSTSPTHAFFQAAGGVRRAAGIEPDATVGLDA